MRLEIKSKKYLKVMKRLTKQENAISYLIASGYSEKEIASKLFIAESTVHTHARNIRRKIHARSAVDVARFYILANPKMFFIATMFLVIQLFTVFVNQDGQEKRFRRLSRNGRRARKELTI